MPYVKLTEIRAGDILVADAGFTCMSAGEKLVQADRYGELYISCSSGRHYLNGQLNDSGQLVGLTQK